MDRAIKARSVAATLAAAFVVVSAGCSVWAYQSGGQAKQSPDQQSDAIDRPTSTPYRGDLSIFEKDGRDEKLHIDRVMDVLGISEGKSVADIGAGSGWFTVRAARRVGASGVVYGVDINEDAVDYIGERAKTEGLAQIRTILGKEDDPLLPARSVDAVLIMKTYHEFSEPIAIMRRVREALKPGAVVGIIDSDGDGSDHGVHSKTVIEELGRAGYTLVEQYDFVKSDSVDYFLVFKATEADKPKSS